MQEIGIEVTCQLIEKHSNTVFTLCYDYYHIDKVSKIRPMFKES